MTYAPSKGATLLVPSGPLGMHLFVILTNACADGFHLWVSITSIRPGKPYDTACTFSGGEHSFIRKPSYVYYRIAEQRRTKSIVFGVEKGLFVPKEDLAPQHFESVCRGIEDSEFIGEWALDYFRENRGR